MSISSPRRSVEDFAIGETIQRNFRSGANSRQTFGKFEKALGWYHKEVEHAGAAPPLYVASVATARCDRSRAPRLAGET